MLRITKICLQNFQIVVKIHENILVNLQTFLVIVLNLYKNKMLKKVEIEETSTLNLQIFLCCLVEFLFFFQKQINFQRQLI